METEPAVTAPPVSPAETPAETAVPAGRMPDRAFIDLFVSSQRRLYLFLLAQTADPQVAEEVLQNANVVILSKWESFEPGTNFLAWAYRVVTLEFLKFRQKLHRSRLTFDDEFLSSVSQTVERLNEDAEDRERALAICLGKLRPKDREIIQLRYLQGGEGKMLSEKLNRPLNSIYQSLGRIRRTLLECIERELATVTR